MKSKRSRVGRKFQAPIPPLLTAKERTEDRAKYLASRLPLRPPGTPISLKRKLSHFKLCIPDPDRLYEQPIPPQVIPDPSKLSKTLYNKIVAKSRRQQRAVKEALRRKMLGRRKSTRRRGTRCETYKEWDDSDNDDYCSFEEFTPDLSPPVEFSPNQQKPPKRKKPARSRRKTKPNRPKKQYVPNRIKPIVIDLVDLSDSPSPETPNHAPSNGAYHYNSTPQSRLIHTQHRPRYPYMHLPIVPGKRSKPPRVPQVLNNLGVNHLPFQSPPQSNKMIGKVTGYRLSPNNAMIPVIEL